VASLTLLILVQTLYICRHCTGLGSYPHLLFFTHHLMLILSCACRCRTGLSTLVLHFWTHSTVRAAVEAASTVSPLSDDTSQSPTRLLAPSCAACRPSLRALCYGWLEPLAPQSIFGHILMPFFMCPIVHLTALAQVLARRATAASAARR
jgi:hypothetical protein